MENIYKFPKNDLINVEEVMKKYVVELQKFSQPKNENMIKISMNFTGTEEEFQNLKDSVSLKNDLELEDSLPVLAYDPEKSDRFGVSNKPFNISSEAFNLETTKEILKYRERVVVGRFRTKKEYIFPKTEYNYKLLNQIESCSRNEQILKPYTDVIISIRIYRPFRYIIGRTTYGPSFQEEYLVLGSQLLTDLRDKISCNFNNRRIMEVSSDPYQELPSLKSDPGFFFITDTFYNDTRDSNNPDYSSIIKEWLENRNEFKQNIYKTENMEKTKFFDLNLRIGYPQVYQHNGNCEHLFCVSSIQLLTENDQLKKAYYPILKSISIQKCSACNMCGERQYSFVIQDSRDQINDPAYLCQQCFEKYHYINGVKHSTFKSYMINKVKVDYDSEQDIQYNI